MASPVAEMALWCSGLTCHPVTVEIGGSNPPRVATSRNSVRPYRIIGCNVVPEDIFDSSLPFTFPVSGNETGHEPHAIDKRININVDWAVDRLQTTENNTGMIYVRLPEAS